MVVFKEGLRRGIYYSKNLGKRSRYFQSLLGQPILAALSLIYGMAFEDAFGIPALVPN
jgi:hypothetical protein